MTKGAEIVRAACEAAQARGCPIVIAVEASTYKRFNVAPPYVAYVAQDGVEPPPGFKWSGSAPPPAVGERVNVTMNGIGPGVVRGYFVEYGWLGLLVQHESPPAWLIKQCGGKSKVGLGHIFGCEFKPI